MASVNNEGNLVVTYRTELIFCIFSIKEGEVTKINTLDLYKEIRATINNSFEIKDRSNVSDMFFMKN